jgi:2-keto-3-deoxy-galactonokinase
MELNAKQAGEAFRTIMLEENHNFLEDDLVLLANAFVRYVEPHIRTDELNKCVEIATNLNRNVGEKLFEVRSNVSR